MNHWNRRLGLGSIQRFSVACVLAMDASASAIAQQEAPALLDAVLGVRRTQLQSLSVARCDHAIIKLDAAHVLVTGGAPSELISIPPLASCEIIDVENGTRRPVASMHVARRGHGIARKSDGCVVVIGGVDEHGALASVERYDPARDAWETLEPMKEARAYFGLCNEEDGPVVVAGGAAGSGDLGLHGNARVLSSVEEFAILGPEVGGASVWESLPPLPLACAHPAMLRWNDGTLYVLGGVTSPATESHSIFNGLNRGGSCVDHPTRAVQRFDFARQAWSSCAALPSAHDAPITASALDEERILVVACPWRVLDDGEHALEVYDVKNARWIEVTPLDVHGSRPWPQPARAPGAVEEAIPVGGSLGQLVGSGNSMLCFNRNRPLTNAFWRWNGDPRANLTGKAWSSYGAGASALVLDGNRLLQVGGTWSGQGTNGVFLFAIDESPR